MNHPKPSLKDLFLKSGRFLEFIIGYNRVGVKPTDSEQLHQSKDLKLLKERLDLLEASLSSFFTIASEKGKGTTIILNLDIAEFDD